MRWWRFVELTSEHVSDESGLPGPVTLSIVLLYFSNQLKHGYERLGSKIRGRKLQLLYQRQCAAALTIQTQACTVQHVSIRFRMSQITQNFNLSLLGYYLSIYKIYIYFLYLCRYCIYYLFLYFKAYDLNIFALWIINNECIQHAGVSISLRIRYKFK